MEITEAAKSPLTLFMCSQHHLKQVNQNGSKAPHLTRCLYQLLLVGLLEIQNEVTTWG